MKYNAMKSEMEKAVVGLKNNYIKNLSLRSSTGTVLLNFQFTVIYIIFCILSKLKHKYTFWVNAYAYVLFLCPYCFTE